MTLVESSADPAAASQLSTADLFYSPAVVEAVKHLRCATWLKTKHATTYSIQADIWHSGHKLDEVF